MSTLSETLLQERVKLLIDKHDGVRAAARVLDISPTYVMGLRDGKHDKPDERLLRKLRIRRRVVFEAI